MIFDGIVLLVLGGLLAMMLISVAIALHVLWNSIAIRRFRCRVVGHRPTGFPHDARYHCARCDARAKGAMVPDGRGGEIIFPPKRGNWRG